MKLIKVKAVVIKEVKYKDNDKIITLLTDKLGKISCIAKGARKTKSPLLANSQYLVYSEFIISKGTSFYYVNSASVINTFYNLRIDFEKLQVAFNLSRIINNITDENQDTEKLLQLFLNTLYVIENFNKDSKFVQAVFNIKLFSLLGFTSNIEKCSVCKKNISDEKNGQDNIKSEYIYFDYTSNSYVCDKCSQEDKRRYIKISIATINAINYTILSDVKNVFSFELKDKALKEYVNYSNAFADMMSSGI